MYIGVELVLGKVPGHFAAITNHILWQKIKETVTNAF